MSKYLHYIILVAMLITQFISCKNPTSSLNPEDSKIDDLIGPTWILFSFISADGTTIKLNSEGKYEIYFAGNNTLQGKADCNTYFSQYTAKDGGVIEIGPIASTEIYCGEQSHSDNYYAALSSVNVFEVNSVVLHLRFGEKGLLQFVKK